MGEEEEEEGEEGGKRAGEGQDLRTRVEEAAAHKKLIASLYPKDWKCRLGQRIRLDHGSYVPVCDHQNQGGVTAVYLQQVLLHGGEKRHTATARIPLQVIRRVCIKPIDLTAVGYSAHAFATN